MALTIDGPVARAIGLLAGLALLGPSVATWVLLGTVTANVPLPPGVEPYVESVIPVLQPAVPGVTDSILPLELLVPAVLFLGVLSVTGLVVVLSALLKPDYTVRVRGGSP